MKKVIAGSIIIAGVLLSGCAETGLKVAETIGKYNANNPNRYKPGSNNKQVNSSRSYIRQGDFRNIAKGQELNCGLPTQDYDAPAYCKSKDLTIKFYTDYKTIVKECDIVHQSTIDEDRYIYPLGRKFRIRYKIWVVKK